MSYNYSYKSSSGGAPGSSSYSSYRSSNSGSGGMPLSTGSFHMDSDMARMKREMEMGMHSTPSLGNTGNSSYSYTSKSSSSGGGPAPTSIHVTRDPLSSTGGHTTKKVVTTTTTKSNPAAQMELNRLTRDFNRIGHTPDNYHDDFDKIKREVLSGEAYRGDTMSTEPVAMRVREEHTRGVPGGRSETTTTTTKRSYGTGAPVSEETVTTTTTSGSSSSRPDYHSETFIPVKTYDNTFDDLHMSRWMDHRDHFGAMPATDLDLHRLDWQNRLDGVKSGMFKFSPHGDFGGAGNSIESTRAVAKPLGCLCLHCVMGRSERRCEYFSSWTRRNGVTGKNYQNPLGKPEFSVQFDMREFKPEDISLTTKHGKLIISATHEEKMGNSTSRREFTRSVDLPSDIQVNLMRSVFSRDGVLSITAPIKPPHYDSNKSMLQTQGQYGNSFMTPPVFDSTARFDMPASTNNHQQEEKRSYVSSLNNSPPSTTNSSYASYTPRATPRTPPLSPTKTAMLNSAPSPSSSTGSGSAALDKSQQLDFTHPTGGYAPEDLTITVEGRKVKIRGKRVETSRLGGRKTHNEFTKVFDLPSHVSPDTVKCYIQDGHTLHIVSSIRDDLQGAVHFLPVTRKW